jgi:copper chaperone CopZ
MVRTTLAIEGMSCGHCVRAVNDALQALDGVQVEETTIGSARIVYDAGRVRPDQIVDAVQREGYKVQSAGGAS